MRRVMSVVGLVALACRAWPALSAPVDVELGWANITPCTRTVWKNKAIFGLPSSHTQTVEQRIYAYARVEAPNANQIRNDIQQCAVQGAAAAGIAQ